MNNNCLTVKTKIKVHFKITEHDVNRMLGNTSILYIEPLYVYSTSNTSETIPTRFYYLLELNLINDTAEGHY